MKSPRVQQRIERGSGYIEVLEPEGQELYYRSCARGMCRYSSDLWQAEIYLAQMLRD